MKTRCRFWRRPILSLFLAILMILSSASCVGQETTVTTEGTTTAPVITTTQPPNGDPTPTPIEPVMLPSQEVKVMSMNVLCNTDTLESRAPDMVATLLAQQVDSIGVQECVTQWTKILDEQLEGYARVGVAVNGQDTGWFATYVYYLKDKYRALDSGTFWMSKTPDVPSKYSDTVDMNRTCTWVVLENIETGFRYVHLNCHLDWMDTMVNVVQVQMMRNMMLRFEEMGYPVFTTGDFNTKEGSIAYGQMLADDRITDSKHVAASTMNPSVPIDYIFVTGERMKVHEYKVLDNKPNGIQISDHKGIYARATVYSLPKQSHEKTVPFFAAELTPQFWGDAVSSSRMYIRFLQATSADGHVADRYEVSVLDSRGKCVCSEIIGAGSYCPQPSKYLTYMLTGGIAGETYRLEITPISLFDERGSTYTQTVKWTGEPLTPTAPTAADIFDLSVKDGDVVDSSPNQYTMTSVGNFTVGDDALFFYGNGNLRTPSIKDQYAKMTDGFTIAVKLTTGADLSRSCPYASNHHAGGFAITGGSGYVNLSVHNGTSYISARAAVDANTTYLVVGIYDGTYLSIYLNGALRDRVELGGAMKLPTADGASYLCIGGDSSENGQGEYNGVGTVHTVSIYSNILNEGNILYLYQQAGI